MDVLLEIDKSIIERTKCPYDFRCLSGAKDSICNVIKDGGFFLCVQNELPTYCPFKLKLITLCLCECDVRLAIYQKYKI